MTLKKLKDTALALVVRRARVQQLERRGQRVVSKLYRELSVSPEELIPKASWDDLDHTICKSRRVCDYVAGMTDAYAEKVYRRLFEPGFGSSADEL